MKKILENEENITLSQGMVDSLIIEDGVCKGVIAESKAAYRAETVIITTGTFMRGKVLMGDLEYESGPNNQRVSIKLFEDLVELGLDITCFKKVNTQRDNDY